MCDKNECYGCEHYDGKDCRNGELLMEQAEAKRDLNVSC